MVQDKLTDWSNLRIILGSFIGLLVGFGATFSANSAIFDPIVASSFGWNRTQTALSYSMSSLGVALFSPIMGKLVDRYGARRIIFIFVWLYCASVAAMSLQNGHLSLWIIISFVAGVTGSATSAMGYLVILPQWFHKKLGLALAIAMLGAATGMILIPFVTKHMIELWGWRQAYIAMSVLILAVSLVALMLLKERSSTTHKEKTSSNTGLTLTEACRNYRFWLLILIFFTVALCTLAIIPHLINLYKDKGLSLNAATQGAAMLGVGVFIGRIIIGLVLDRIKANYLTAFFVASASLGLFILSNSSNYYLLLLSSLLIGLAMGIEGDLAPYLIKSYFGIKTLGMIMGIVFGMFCLGAITGPLLMGLVYDFTQDYIPFIDLAIIMLAILAVTALCLGTKYFEDVHK